MSCLRSILVFLLICMLFIMPIKIASGFTASEFTFQDGDWYDDWGINRNYYGGPNGYLPNLALETLNENKDLAFGIGQQFQEQYSSKVDLAVAILKFVQTWTEYGYDSDNVFRSGVAQDEWAWNADEMAYAFNPDTGVKAIGDCEDLAFLCGTIYVGAGFDAAVIDAIDHVALLIWLPEFSNADYYWDLPNDNRDAGWLWVEATGSSNPLGWTPPDYENGGWTAYPIGALDFVAEPQPSEETGLTSTGLPSIDLDILLVIVGIIFSIILTLMKARRR